MIVLTRIPGCLILSFRAVCWCFDGKSMPARHAVTAKKASRISLFFGLAGDDGT
jgi:hypothetical protein